MDFDVFVSHASEDKDYVEPLVQALQASGFSVWYDRLVLVWGDDLRSKIDNGLKRSRFVIVVLSKAFLGLKKWTEYELSSAFALESVNEKRILPLWHGITKDDLLEYSPFLANRLARLSSHSHDEIIADLKNLLSQDVLRARSTPKESSSTTSRIAEGNREALRAKTLLTVSGSRFELTPAQLTFSITLERFVLPIPEDLRDRLLDAAPRFEAHAETATRAIHRLIAEAETLIPDVRSRIDAAARSTAENLVRKAEIGDSVFNAPLFNVLRMPTGADKDENSAVVVELYETDYFTLQTLLNAFNALKLSGGQEFDLESSEVRHALRIFRTGFGLNCTVCVVPRKGDGSTPPERMLIFGRRSARAGRTSSTGTWHVTANEALTQKDVVDQQISLNNFIVRALDEEVGIRPEQIGRAYVFNVYIYLADMQPGMNALVFCEVDDLDEIFFRISGSMDGTIEYDSHIAIPFRDESIREALRQGGWPEPKTGEIIPFSATADSLLRSVLKRGVRAFTEGL